MRDALKTQVLLNPTAGNCKCKRLFPTLKAKLSEKGIAHHFSFSQYCGHIKELTAKARKQDCKKIIVCQDPINHIMLWFWEIFY